MSISSTKSTKRSAEACATARYRPVALLLPGQGAQYARMGAGLYGHSSVFTSVMDTAFRLMGKEGPRVRADWLSDCSPALFDDVSRAQPLLYAVDCALGFTVLSWGVKPAALLGHSVGELAAATLAGVFDLADGVRLLQNLIRVCVDTPPGGMLAVAASSAELAPYLSDDVVVGALNAPRQVMLAGPAGPLAETERKLRADGYTCKPVRARQPFHSPAMSSVVARSTKAWEATTFRAPCHPIYSAYRGAVLSSGDARDPSFWAHQPADPVLFGPTLDRLLNDRELLLVEAGPGQGLSALAHRHAAVTSGRSAVAAMLPARPGSPEDDFRTARQAAERIGAEGHALDWAAVV